MGILLLVFLPVSPVFSAEIALIIDDMGNAKRDADAFSLPKEVAFSILPHKPLSLTFSNKAASQQREVMLHIPMESLAGKRLGPGALTSDMHPVTIHEVLQSALATVPHATGVNNHMGSKLTQLTLPMSATMEFLQTNQLFFVDSRTTRFSKANNIALQKGVLSGKRNVFLDHFAEQKHIDMQFKRLIRLAKKYDKAIGIAHPYPQTLQYLEQALTDLESEGVVLVPPSTLLEGQQLARNEQKNKPEVVVEQALK